MLIDSLRRAARDVGITVVFVPVDEADEEATEFYRSLQGAESPVHFFVWEWDPLDEWPMTFDWLTCHQRSSAVYPNRCATRISLVGRNMTRTVHLRAIDLWFPVGEPNAIGEVGDVPHIDVSDRGGGHQFQAPLLEAWVVVSVLR
jgi:hypothetical protein